jgi:pimeloyl-ACP methyl ester carboxylesterase
MLGPHAARLHIEDQSINLGDLSLNFRRWTRPMPRESHLSAPTFLLLHGLGSALRIFDSVAPWLVNGRGGQAIAVDQRGHGRSDKPDQGYSTAQIVADDYALAAALNLNKPVVIGHSWGATIALAYGIAHPDAVSAVVLVDGVLGNMKEMPGMSWEQVERDVWTRQIAGLPKEKHLEKYLTGTNGQYFAPIWSPDLEDIILNIVQLREDGTVEPRLGRANEIQIMRSLWETPHISLAAQVTCPVLMIAAEPRIAAGDKTTQSWIEFRRDGARKMLSAMTQSPKAELVVMHDSVHDVPLQRPEALSKIILQFVGAGTR